MKKVIPPFLFLLCILLMIALKFLIPEPQIVSSPINYLGVLLIITGIAMINSIRKLYDEVNTEIHTFKKPRTLITTGLFKISRNPIYLGFTIALIGVWIILGNLTSIVGCLLFFIAANFWYIPFEENNLEKEFGEDYKIYKLKVRRWI